MVAPKGSIPASLGESAEQLGLKPLHGELKELARGGYGIVTGTRIPYEFYTTKGFGETDEGGGVDPWETGSYDIAMENAEIANFNILAYTSCIPVEAKEISFEAANKTFHHGAVAEVIMARMDGQKGDRISAGVARASVKKKDGTPVSGFAAEYRGHAKEELVKKILQEDLEGIFARRYSSEYEMSEAHFTIMVEEVHKSFGTVLAAICFTSFISPILKPS